MKQFCLATRYNGYGIHTRKSWFQTQFIDDRRKGKGMMGQMHGKLMSLALTFLMAAASMAAQAPAPAPGQPVAQPQNQPAAAPQTQPATPAPVEQKKVSTGLGQDFSIVKPMFPNPIAPYTAGTIPPPVFVNSPRVQQRIQDGKLLISMQDAIELASKIIRTF